jgi:SPP1 family predicted phage head-tail adaptor
MNHRLRIESVTATQDAYGAPTNTWATFATVWGEITPLSGFERVIAVKTESQVTHRVRIQYLTGVLPTMRMIYDSRTFNVLSVINSEERNRELILNCQEVVA